MSRLTMPATHKPFVQAPIQFRKETWAASAAIIVLRGSPMSVMPGRMRSLHAFSEADPSTLYACCAFALAHMAAKSSLFRPIFSNRSAITGVSRSLSESEVKAASCLALISSGKASP